MPTISSLMRSAAATRQKIQNQQDAQVSFDWENSAQTYDDYVAYSSYLQKQSQNSTDPSQLMTYATKERSARRSYVSNELQRQQMAIMEGKATTQDKMESVKQLYYQAVDNGDMNLAQNLLSQWDTLSVKAQNEVQAATKAYASAGDKAFKNLINSIEKGVDDVTLPTGQKITPLASISDYFSQTGDSVASMKSAEETMSALTNIIVDAYQNATNQDQIDTLESKYGPGLRDLGDKIKISVGGKNLGIQDIVNANANEKMNNPIYSLQAVRNEVTGTNEYKLKTNNVERLDYARQIDEQGNEYYTPVTVRTTQDNLFFGSSDQGRGLNTEITNNGFIIGGNESKQGKQAVGSIGDGTKVNRDESQTLGNRLKALGITAKQNGTTLTIQLPGENVERQGTIQPDGSIRYFGDDGKMYEVGTTDRNLGMDPVIDPQTGQITNMDNVKYIPAGQPREVAPDEGSDFGTKSAFGGDLSVMGGQGHRYLQSILGNKQTPEVLNGNSPINTANDFRGFGSPVTGSGLQGTSALLQGAGATRQYIQQQQAKEAMVQAQNQAAAKLQASATFNLNQTPVQQIASNGLLKKQLQVAAPTPTQRLYVAAPAPTPTITNVGVARPTGSVSVSNSSGARSVRVQ